MTAVIIVNTASALGQKLAEVLAGSGDVTVRDMPDTMLDSMQQGIRLGLGTGTDVPDHFLEVFNFGTFREDEPPSCLDLVAEKRQWVDFNQPSHHPPRHLGSGRSQSKR